MAKDGKSFKAKVIKSVKKLISRGTLGVYHVIRLNTCSPMVSIVKLSNISSGLVLSKAMCKFSAQQSLAEQSHVQYYDERTRLSELSKKITETFQNHQI